MKLKYIFATVLSVFVLSHSMAQVDRKHNREGMRAVKDKDFNDAIINFQKSIKENPGQSDYINNLGHAHYRNEDYENSAKDYAIYADKLGLSKAEQFYNLGNAFLQAGEYDKGIKSYIQSLKLNSDDEETKYNLSMAHAMKRQQQQRQQQQNKNKDKNKQQDKQEQNKDKQNQDDKKDQQQQNQEQQEQQKKQEMSREEAERMLNALQKKEEELQDKQKKKAKANFISNKPN